MLELIVAFFLTTSSVEPPTKYDMESALTAIKAIEKEHTIPDIDRDLIAYLELNQADLELLSMITFAESNLEIDHGQQLVVHVVLNRVNSGKWGDTIEQVLYSPNQFCGVKLRSWGEYNGNNIRNVLLAKYKRKFGLVSADVLELLYFNNESVNSKMYANKYGLDIIQKVDNHTFYSISRGGKRK